MSNMTRDLKWIGQITTLTTQDATAFGAVLCSTDGIVYDQHGYVGIGAFDLKKTKDEFFSFGVLMRNQVIQNIPFRVKAHSAFDDTFWGVGWSVPGEPEVFSPRFVSSGRIWDDTIVVRDAAEGVPADAQYCFFAHVPGNAGYFCADISVQNLLRRGDGFNSRLY